MDNVIDSAAWEEEELIEKTVHDEILKLASSVVEVVPFSSSVIM